MPAHPQVAPALPCLLSSAGADEIPHPSDSLLVPSSAGYIHKPGEVSEQSGFYDCTNAGGRTRFLRPLLDLADMTTVVELHFLFLRLLDDYARLWGSYTTK